MDSHLLDGIDSPEDLRNLSMDELGLLAVEIRRTIIKTVAGNGGHLAPNLGSVELTLALHRVFHEPQDKIIWDVGHQSYTHKLVTGRRAQFGELRQTGGISGFPSRSESPYDVFGAGHAGTSISAAMGFAAARDIGHLPDHVVAVIGDGSLICGIALEAMNNLRSSCKNMIIILNDNKMSISKSIGAIPNILNQIITGRNYNRFKAFAKMMLHRMPGGSSLVGNIQTLESSAKSFFVPGIFFEEMGIRYIGPIDGHRIGDLIQTFERVREFNRPVLVHVITEKGHGCEYAREQPEHFHGIGRFHPETGETLNHPSGHSFSSAFGRALTKRAEEDPKLVAVTAAMASGCGIPDSFQQKYPDRFFDVGIAEEHAIVFSAGLAAAGYHPVAVIYATFLQRALDCIFHDICLQNLPVILCADRAGIVEDGPTHHGIYDTAFLRSMPALSILQPADETEFQLMFDAAFLRKAPVLLRYPKSDATPLPDMLPAPPVVWGRGRIVREGSDAALFASGRESVTALQAAKQLAEKARFSLAVIDVRFLKPFDTELLCAFAERMPIFTLEDHVKQGGLMSIVNDALAERHLPCAAGAFGWDADRLVPHGNILDAREKAGITPCLLADRILKTVRGNSEEPSARLKREKKTDRG